MIRMRRFRMEPIAVTVRPTRRDLRTKRKTRMTIGTPDRAAVAAYAIAAAAEQLAAADPQAPVRDAVADRPTL